MIDRMRHRHRYLAYEFSRIFDRIRAPFVLRRAANRIAQLSYLNDLIWYSMGPDEGDWDSDDVYHLEELGRYVRVEVAQRIHAVSAPLLVFLEYCLDVEPPLQHDNDLYDPWLTDITDNEPYQPSDDLEHREILADQGERLAFADRRVWRKTLTRLGLMIARWAAWAEIDWSVDQRIPRWLRRLWRSAPRYNHAPPVTYGPGQLEPALRRLPFLANP